VIKTRDKFSLFWPDWQQQDRVPPARSASPAWTHSADESRTGTERTQRIPADCACSPHEGPV